MIPGACMGLDPYPGSYENPQHVYRFNIVYSYINSQPDPRKGAMRTGSKSTYIKPGLSIRS